MRTFLKHVAKTDAVAESGLKVIAYFDALVEHRATLEACVRAAAALSECVAGLRDDSSPLCVRFNRRGVLVDGPPSPSTSRPVRIGDQDVGEVWLEREEGPMLLDELIKSRPWSVLHHFGKHAILMRHDVGPFYVPERCQASAT